jgi:hypothetical protein
MLALHCLANMLLCEGSQKFGADSSVGHAGCDVTIFADTAIMPPLKMYVIFAKVGSCYAKHRKTKVSAHPSHINHNL